MAGRSFTHALLGAGLGALSWTATEYATHRWVLHGPFGKGKLKQVPLGTLHRTHHRKPDVTCLHYRLAGHAAIAATAAAASTGLAMITPVTLARCAAAAWAAGYSTYEVVHWNAHHRNPRSAWAQRVHDRHMRHHFGAPSRNLGVTMSWWDQLLGTEAPAFARAATADERATAPKPHSRQRRSRPHLRRVLRLPRIHRYRSLPRTRRSNP